MVRFEFASCIANCVTRRALVKAIIIDDSRAMRMILKRIINGIGIESVEATDGSDALQLLASLAYTPDVALIDWNMPNINGYDLLLELRANTEYAKMRIVMVTTEVEMLQVSKALDAGADEYVMKPFTPEMIVEKLGQIGIVQAAA